jgi:hypothetical protein
LDFLNRADIAQGNIEHYIGGFGSKNLSAPQAGLMAMLSKGIVGGSMTWPLIVFGMFMGLGLILMQVKSPMLIAVGMYLPLETTFAIFLGGLIKGIVDIIVEKRNYAEAQKIKIENIGILIASGLIAGEALTGLIFAPLKIYNVKFKQILFEPHFLIGMSIIVLIGIIMVMIPIRNAGKADDPIPPSAGV